LPENYEQAFWDEIYGCVQYIGLPYETVMSMPVQNRKIWIQKHNIEQAKRDNPNNDSGGISGEALNGYARIEQQKLKTQ
jgi:hypothetical protein